MSCRRRGGTPARITADLILDAARLITPGNFAETKKLFIPMLLLSELFTIESQSRIFSSLIPRFPSALIAVMPVSCPNLNSRVVVVFYHACDYIWIPRPPP